MADRKSVLIVEDDLLLTEDYKKILGDRGYNVTSIFYEGSRTEIPLEKFDAAVVDGLNGDWKYVVDKINSDLVVIVSGNDYVIEKAKKDGFRTGEKPLSTDEIMELLQ